MKIRMAMWCFMGTMISMGTLWCQSNAVPQDAAAFLKDLEQKAAAIDRREAKWIKKEFTDAFMSPDFGEDRREQAMQYVLLLQEKRTKFSVAGMGYLKGVFVLANARDWTTWNDWHAHLDFFLNQSKKRDAAEAYLKGSRDLLLTGVLFEGKSTTWAYRSGELTLAFDDADVPIVICDGGSLVCLSRGDSSLVHGARGAYSPLEQRFLGEFGKVNWDRTKYANQLEATLGEFEVRLKGNSFRSPNATLTGDFFAESLTGELSFAVETEKKEEKRSYPRFETSAGNVELPEIFAGITYLGGLQFRGSEMIGIGSGGNFGTLQIFKDDTLFIQCRSNQMLFGADQITAQQAALTMYIGEDSIYHNNIEVRYLDALRLFRATRKAQGVGQEPLTDTYHALQIDVDAIVWEMNSSNVLFRSLTTGGGGFASFRSLDCFQRDAFERMRGIDPVHPLLELGGFLQEESIDSLSVFDASRFSQYLRMSEEQAIMMLMRLSNEGYVEYNSSNNICTVLPMSKKHLEANRGNIDHDVLALYSQPQNTPVNATLSLSTKRLNVSTRGDIRVSDAQNVIFKPIGDVSIGKNRHFDFAGTVIAGRFKLSDGKFHFDYDSFRLDVEQCEVDFQAATGEGIGYDGNEITEWVKSTISDVSGTLEIDHPTNKSGWRSERFASYPKLNSRDVSHVYYDDRNIQGGAYHADRFNYALDPFSLESLDDFSNEHIVFAGELIAGGIIPDVQDSLRLMEDFSLGIRRSTPDDGLPLYGGIGTVKGDLRLDLDGLHGPTSIEFLTSHLVGEDNVLVPDSTFGRTTEYRNTSSPKNVPSVSATATRFRLLPKGERLFVRTEKGEEPLRFFEEDVFLRGELELSSAEMRGRGAFLFDRALLTSKDFEMRERTVAAQNSGFELKGADLTEIAIGTEDVASYVDFDARRGDFKSHQGATLIDLPTVNYTCLMDEFSWFMDEDRLDLMNTLIDPSAMTFKDLADRSQSNFFSQKSNQDSLHFLSPRATYHVDEAFVECFDVKSIAVADAEINPGDGQVLVRRDAAMDPLTNCELYANDVTRYHRIYDALIEIKGRRKYLGSGTSNYVDGQGIEWPVVFEEIGVDEAGTTYGTGKVLASDNFFLSAQFAFQGKVNLEAGRPYFEFDGGTEMQLECEDYPSEWIEFKGVIDPSDVAIPIDSVITEMGKGHLAVGWTYEDGGFDKVYPAFFTKKPARSDISFFEPQGFLRYDRRKDRYVVCNEDKFKNVNLPGNLTQISRGSCDLFQSGKAAFPLNDKRLFDQFFVGDVSNSNGVMVMRGGLVIDAPFPDVLLSHLSKKLVASEWTSSLTYNQTNYEQILSETVGFDESGRLLDLLARSTTSSFGEKDKMFFQSRASELIVFHGMEWRYNKYDERWESEGEVGIATLGENNVWRKLQGKIVLDKRNKKCLIYLHVNKDQWYFMEYVVNRGVLNVESKEAIVEGEDSLWQVLKDASKEVTDVKIDGKEFLVRQPPQGSGSRNGFVDEYREFDD